MQRMDMIGEGRAGNRSMIEADAPGRKRRGLGFDLVALPVLAIIGLLTGYLVNAFRIDPLPWRYRNRAQIIDATVAGLQPDFASTPDANEPAEPTHEIRLEGFQPFVAEHRGPVLDARAAVFYREAHVPGALSLPRETFAEDYARLHSQLEAYKDRPVAVYCSGADCPDSQLVADALAKLGYRRLVIYTSGWEEWSHTGLPQEGTNAMP